MDRPMKAPTCPPGIHNASLATAFGIYNAVIQATTEYWTGVISRGATPIEVGLDVLDWYSTMNKLDRPTWATPYVVTKEWPIARLLDFSDAKTDGESAGQVPTLILPPQAGHDSCIVDFAPNQSQIQTAKDAGLQRIYSFDWLGATQETKNATIEDYLAVIAEAVDELGGRVNIVGDCQGGWLGVIYAALHPDDVHTLTIAGAPVDFHAGGAVIHEWTDVLSPAPNDLAFYRTLVQANNGTLPGEYQLAGFITMQPEVEVDRQLQLLVHLHEREHVERYRLFETWFKHTQPIAGAFYLWIVEHLFQNNELVEGTLTIDGQVVNLKNVSCPLYLLAGSVDHITPGPQVFALADYASTAPEEITQVTAPGGHLGLFMGRESLMAYWAPLFAAIAARPA